MERCSQYSPVFDGTTLGKLCERCGKPADPHLATYTEWLRAREEWSTNMDFETWCSIDYSATAITFANVIATEPLDT